MYGDDAWKAACVLLAIVAVLALIGLGAMLKWAFF